MGGYLRNLIKKNTSTHFKSLFWGSVLGLIAIDPILTICIIASLWSSQSISSKKAMILCTWANFGACFLYFLAFINMDLLILYLLGIVGVAYFLEKPFQLRHVMGTLFALLLLLYALMLIKSQSAKIIEISFVKESINQIHNSYFTPFLFAAVLTCIIQADIVVLVLVAGLAAGHVLSENQTLFMVYGTQAGLGLVGAIITWNVKGMMKQLFFIQALVNLVIGLFFAFLLMIELCTGIPMVKALILSISKDPWPQILFLIFFTNIIVCSVISFFIDPIYAWINKLIPLSGTADPSRPTYLSQSVINDPECFLDLLELELTDLFKRLPQYLAYKIEHFSTEASLELQHTQFKAVMQELDQLLKEFNLQIFTPETASRMLMLTERMNFISLLELDTYYLTQINLPANISKSLRKMALEIYQAQLDWFQRVILMDKRALGAALAEFHSTLEKFQLSDLRREKGSSILGKALILKMINHLDRNLWIIENLYQQYRT